MGIEGGLGALLGAGGLLGGETAAVAAPAVAEAALPAAEGVGAGLTATAADSALTASIVPGAETAVAGLAPDALAAGAPLATDALSGTLPFTADALGSQPLAFASADPAAAGTSWGSINAAGATSTDASNLFFDPVSDQFTTGAGDVVSGAGTTGGTVAAPAATAGASGGGATSALTSALNSPWTRVGLAAAPLAIGLSGIGTKLPASALAAQANAQALANQGGNLNPAQQAVLSNMRQNLTNQWRQTLFNMGVQNPGRDTRWPQIMAQIDTQVAAASQQMIQQNISNALQGDAQLIQLANLQMQEDRNFQNTLTNATKALGTAAGLGGTTRTVTTTTSPAAA